MLIFPVMRQEQSCAAVNKTSLSRQLQNNISRGCKRTLGGFGDPVQVTPRLVCGQSARTGIQTLLPIPRVLQGTDPSGAGLICSSASASAWAGRSELSAPGNNSRTAIPSIAASAQSIAFCVSSQCTAAHVYTHKKHKLV